MQGLQHIATIVQGLRVILPYGEGAVITDQCVVKTLQLLQYIAAIVEGFGEIGTGSKRRIETRQRSLEILQALKRAPPIIERIRVVRPYGQGTVHQCDSSGETPHLQVNDTEQVKRVGVVGVCCQNLAVKRLRFGQPPSLVEMKRFLEHERKRPHCHEPRVAGRPGYLEDGLGANNM